MLSDREIQATADQAVTPELEGFVAVRECELSDPSGVYFVLRHRSSLESPSDRLETRGVLGTAGFFVYRATGNVRFFALLEFVKASRAVERAQGRCELPEDLPRVLTHLLAPYGGDDSRAPNRR